MRRSSSAEGSGAFHSRNRAFKESCSLTNISFPFGAPGLTPGRCAAIRARDEAATLRYPRPLPGFSRCRRSGVPRRWTARSRHVAAPGVASSPRQPVPSAPSATGHSAGRSEQRHRRLLRPHVRTMPNRKVRSPARSLSNAEPRTSARKHSCVTSSAEFATRQPPGKLKYGRSMPVVNGKKCLLVPLACLAYQIALGH